MEIKQLTEPQIELLRKPLPKEAVKPHPTKTFLSSIKAIYVVERLNDVFGIGGWYANNEVVKQDGKMVVVKSTFHAPEYGILIPDIFGGNDNADLGDAYKGACTDALTKIGSYLYIGMDVYKGLSDKDEKPPAKPAPVKKLKVPTDDEFVQLLARVEKEGEPVITKAKEYYTFTTDQYTALYQKAKLKTA